MNWSDNWGLALGNLAKGAEMRVSAPKGLLGFGPILNALPRTRLGLQSFIGLKPTGNSMEDVNNLYNLMFKLYQGKDPSHGKKGPGKREKEIDNHENSEVNASTNELSITKAPFILFDDLS